MGKREDLTLSYLNSIKIIFYCGWEREKEKMNKEK
jgi:hypothetical protein